MEGPWLSGKERGVDAAGSGKSQEASELRNCGGDIGK